MPRNAPHILTPGDLDTIHANRSRLPIGKPVTLDFLTRQGEPRTYSGTVESLIGVRQGNASTEAVVITLDDGSQKAANLWAISAIR